MRQEHYDAMSAVLHKSGINSFEIRPPLGEGEDMPCAEIIIDLKGMLPDTDLGGSSAVAMNALVVAGVVRVNAESKSQIVAQTVGPSYIFLIDTGWQRPPAPRKRHLPPLTGRRRNGGHH